LLARSHSAPPPSDPVALTASKDTDRAHRVDRANRTAVRT